MCEIKKEILKINEHKVHFWSELFARENIVVMDLLSLKLKEEIKKEALLVLKKESSRRDIKLKETGDTWRNYQAVGRDSIKKNNDYRIDCTLLSHLQATEAITTLSKAEFMKNIRPMQVIR